MMTEDQRRQAISSLTQAHRTKKPCLQLSATFPSIEIADSYAISSAMAELKVAGGARLIGHKIGLTSKAMQASSQIDEPDYGHLFDDMLIQDGAKVQHANFCVPRVEAGIDLHFKGAPEGAECRPDRCAPCHRLHRCRPSEIIDARVQNRERFSIPSPITVRPRVWYSVAGRCGRRMSIFVGGGLVLPQWGNRGDRLAAGVLGHPAMAIAWLAN